VFKSRILAFGLLTAFVALSIAAPANSASPIDRNFGSGGKVFTNFGFTAVKVNADVQTFPLTDGKTLVFQPYGDNGLKAAKVYRMNVDGSLDTTFGKNGILLGDLGAGFNLLPGEHPIIPVMLGDAKLAQEMAARLYEQGIYVTGFFFPVVPKGQARIRTQMSAAHSTEDIDAAIAAFTAAGQELGVI